MVSLRVNISDVPFSVPLPGPNKGSGFVLPGIAVLRRTKTPDPFSLPTTVPFVTVTFSFPHKPPARSMHQTIQRSMARLIATIATTVATLRRTYVNALRPFNRT